MAKKEVDWTNQSQVVALAKRTGGDLAVLKTDAMHYIIIHLAHVNNLRYKKAEVIYRP